VTTYKTKIKLHETDAAGVLFFTSQFKIAHDAYEVFLTQIGYPIYSFISDLDYFLPIVHAEADYFSRLCVGVDLSVKVGVEKIGDSSFTLRYIFEISEGKKVGEVKTVHVSLDKKSRKKITLPHDLRSALTDHLIS